MSSFEGFLSRDGLPPPSLPAENDDIQPGGPAVSSGVSAAALERSAPGWGSGGSGGGPRKVLPGRAHTPTRAHTAPLPPHRYAMEAISNAGSCVGILAKDGVVLAAEKRITSKVPPLHVLPPPCNRVPTHCCWGISAA